MLKSSIQKQKGFTLIETLVAILLLLVSITAPLTAAQNGLRAGFLARDQVVAFYLAQDVIESIKHLRDNYALGGGTGDWLTSLSATGCNPGAVGTARLCTIDTSGDNSISLTSCNDPDICGRLYYDENSKKYGHDGTGELSKFSRRVYVTELVSGQEAQVLVEVEWDSNFFSIKRVVVQENIYNWVPSFTN